MPHHQPLIRVIGSLNIDFVTTTPRVPAAGETLTATALSVNAGGKGANQAVGCGRASYLVEGEEPDVKVQMVGAVGKGDPYYESLLKPTLERSGVEMHFVREVEGTQTGTATILVDEGAGGENRILVVPGANDVGMREVSSLLKISEAEGEVEPDVVVMQGEIPRSTVLGLLEHYNSPDGRTRVIFNPAPVFPDGIPLGALKNLAVLVVNETECVLLAKSLQKSGVVDSIPSGPEAEEELDISKCEAFADLFHTMAEIEIVLITLGAKGVFFSSNSNPEQNARSQQRTHELIPGVKVKKVVDTTAAGDTFVGYFATALARHSAGDHKSAFDIAVAVARANSAAALCVQKAGAMQSIPFAHELSI